MNSKLIRNYRLIPVHVATALAMIGALCLLIAGMVKQDPIIVGFATCGIAAVVVLVRDFHAKFGYCFDDSQK